jgi:broad specificity phosphatase PhoE
MEFVTIVLCRHGATDENVAGGFLSRRDPPLNGVGREQSERTHAALRGMTFGLGLSSPMRRCVETLEIVAPRTPYRRDEALREVDFGAWEGRTIEWLETNDATGVAQRRRDPVTFRPAGGESFLDASHRLRTFADAVRRINSGSIIIVGHRGSLGILERLLRGLPLESRQVAPLEPGEFRIIEMSAPS